MRNILTIALIFISFITFSQNVKIDSTLFTIKHGDITLYLDKDTCTYVSVHTISAENIKKLDSERDDKWHKEKPFGPYNRDCYVHSGYDLGHLTPAHITSYDDSLQYHSFSFFNQAPQLAEFNRGKWKALESQVEKEILASKSNAIVVTGVLYDKDKEYMVRSRVKIPLVYYKILITKTSTKVWIGSNTNGLVLETTLEYILDFAKKNGNSLGIIITH